MGVPLGAFGGSSMRPSRLSRAVSAPLDPKQVNYRHRRRHKQRQTDVGMDVDIDVGTDVDTYCANPHRPQRRLDPLFTCICYLCVRLRITRLSSCSRPPTSTPGASGAGPVALPLAITLQKHTTHRP
jgi:hypothetical protein